MAPARGALAYMVLEGLTQLWRRPVRLETVRSGKPMRLGHDGDKPSEESLVEPAA